MVTAKAVDFLCNRKAYFLLDQKKTAFYGLFLSDLFEYEMFNLFKGIAAFSVNLAQSCACGAVDDLRVRYNVIA